MPHIATVTGSLNPALAGRVSAGDHLLARLPMAEPERASDAWFADQPLTMSRLGDAMLGRANRDDAYLDQITSHDELEDFAEAGGGLVIEHSTPAQGAGLADLARLSAGTGVAIVATAHAEEAASAQGLQELLDGGYGLLAAAVTGDSFGGVARVIEAAAQSEAPVLLRLAPAPLPGRPASAAASTEPVHSTDADEVGTDKIGTDGARPEPAVPDQAALTLIDAALAAVSAAAAAGVGPSRLALTGLSCLVPVPGALARLAESGAYLVFERLGRIPNVYTLVSDHDVAEAIAALIRAGHGRQILLSAGLDRKHACVDYGGNGLAFLSRQFLPYLGFFGVEAEQSEALLSANPARFLTWTEPAA